MKTLTHCPVAVEAVVKVPLAKARVHFCWNFCEIVMVMGAINTSRRHNSNLLDTRWNVFIVRDGQVGGRFSCLEDALIVTVTTVAAPTSAWLRR